jgi:hypothetical protein
MISAEEVGRLPASVKPGINVVSNVIKNENRIASPSILMFSHTKKLKDYSSLS